MRQPVVLCSSLLVSLAFAASAHAATLYTSPTGTATSGCSRDMPCDLGSAATAAMPGDTVILMDGVYKTGLSVPEKTGSSSSAWITFQADDCALPIIEGTGESPTSTNQDSGVQSSKGTYLRFVGIVSRGWNIGFNNGWTGTDTTNSNGHFEFKYCIGDSNGRSGFSFFSAEGIHIQNCIAAHNGSSIAESWSSGITLYEAQGGAGASIIEGNVSFENMDNHEASTDQPGAHSDGNGFIIDEYSNGATFVNNIGFRNGGSCLRLTKSSNAKFINNTCYHNAQDTRDQGPSNPGEIYFTDSPTKMGVSIMNNVFVATGSGPGAQAVYGQPTSGWSNNVVSTGTVSYFTNAEGNNPDFTLASSASTLIGKGGTGSDVPTKDIGFDPKCIVKKAPTVIGSMGKGSWWQYSIDYDYIKSIGGVAKCFNPGNRSGTPDIGAYKNGAVTTSSGTCVPAGTGGSSGTGGSGNGSGGGGGASSSGGSNGGGAAGMTSKGGAGGVGGTSGAAGSSNSAGGSSAGNGNTAGNAGSGNQAGNSSAGSNGGGASNAGGSTGAGGNNSSNGGNGQSTGNGGASNATGGSSSTSGGNNAAKGGGTSAAGSSSGGGENSGCGCTTVPHDGTSGALLGLGFLGLGMVAARRRRQAR